MPTRGSLAVADRPVAATGRGIAAPVAGLAPTGVDFVFAGGGPDGNDPMESIEHGKFW
jgi:hypothetical protein